MLVLLRPTNGLSKEVGKTSRGPRAVLCLLQLLTDAQIFKVYSGDGGGNHEASLDAKRFTNGGNEYISCFGKVNDH